jgi:beta-galactosidase GanA
MGRLMRNVLTLAHLNGPEQDLPPDVRLRQGTLASGDHVRFFFNYSATPVKVRYAFPDGEDLLTKKVIRGRLTLEPWGVAIVAER